MTHKYFEREMQILAKNWGLTVDSEELWELTKEILAALKEKEEEFVTTVIEDKEKIQNKIVQNKIEQEILMKTRGVFKYRTSCYAKSDISTRNEFVQIGYLDLYDNIVFNEPDEEYVEHPDRLVRYLPGFWVKGYNSCQEYLPDKDIKGGGIEVKEVISEFTIKYSPNCYSNNKVIYSVIGYLNDDNQLVYYEQIVNKKN